MTDTADPGDALAVWCLSIGQTVSFASLYFSFGALIVALEAGLGWSKAELALGPTLGLVVAGLASPLAGRLVDRGYGGEVLVVMPVLGAAALAGLAFTATQPLWLALWMVIGLAQAGSLYDTCFSFLIRRLGLSARAAITRVTLIAGFASTLAFPYGAALAHAGGHRAALLGFALPLALVAAPANALAVVRLRSRARAVNRRRPAEPGVIAAALRRPEFWSLGAIFGLIWMNHALLVTFALPVLAAKGASPGLAVLAASCFGPAQVAARLALMLVGARLSGGRATALSIGAMVAGALVLLVAGLAVPLIFAFALLQGAGIGAMSILRPVLTAEVLGERGFGTIAGALSVAPLFGAAAAPVLGAALLAQGGAGALIAAALAIAAVSLALALSLTRRQPYG